MDKKNAMLLTVIAVATLLVAVVGATFAYFTVGGDSSTTSTTVTTKAEAVGAVSLNAGSGPFYLNLTADQMSYENRTHTYYATTTADADALESAPAATNVALIEAAAVATADVTYKCTFNYSVTTTGDAAAMAVLASDSVLTLSADSGVTLNGTSFNLGTASGDATKGTGEVTLTDGTTKAIKALVSFTNTEEIQDGLKGKSGIVTTVSFDTFNCDTVANS